MIRSLKPYPAYKDSNAPWLGEVPEHWAEKRAKYFFREVDERSMAGEEELLSVSHLTGVTPRSQKNVTMFLAESTVGHKLCRSGDVVVNTMWAWMGALGVAKQAGLVSPSYAVYRPRRPVFIPELLDDLLRTSPYISEYICRSTGITTSRLRLYPEQFLRIVLPCPPLQEQRLIMRFVAAMSRRVRRYIRAKQKSIALLNEQKQAIIQHAVTRGLDPNVYLKPSGVDGLGDVPEHWDVRKFTGCAIERADYRGATPTKVESGVFLVTARNIRRGWIDYQVSREFVASQEYDKIMRRGLPRCGDLLLTTEAPLGNAALVDREDIALAQRVIRFRFDSQLLVPKFALHSVLSPYFQHQLLCRATGSTAAGIKASKLPQLAILCPPIAEQHQILSSIESECAPLDRITAQNSHEADLLREYRTRLIADVVTGKVDVREAAVHLTGEPEEPEPLQELAAEAEDEVDDSVQDADYADASDADE